MGKINGCLKCLFIFFNVLFGIIGALLVVGVVKATAFQQQLAIAGNPNLAWGWVFALGMLLVSCLGIFAGCSEKELALKVFAGCMATGLLTMMIFGIIVAVQRNKLKTNLQEASSDFIKPFMKDDAVKSFLKDLQRDAKCCGVGSPKDWGTDIPESCACRGSNCKAKPQGMTGPDQIFKMTCSGLIFVVVDLVFKIAMGFFFGFAVTALLGLLVSLLMIYQVRRHDGGMGGQSMAMKGY
ncbi:tetraspanin-33-like [Myripristis murdjan]|uniref:Tetraspanin n=1 Tax=Myripristis murdjan TaxID=586833 RepID=A0A667XHY5_9TELE|nr:tetraspanin-33-like [Myripristis murdjan]